MYTDLEQRIIDTIESTDVHSDYIKQWRGAFDTFHNTPMEDVERLRKYKILMDAIDAQVESKRLSSNWYMVKGALIKSIEDVREVGAVVLGAAKNLTSPVMLFLIAGIIVLYFITKLKGK